MDRSQVLTLAAIQGASMFLGVMPEISDVRRCDPNRDPEFVKDLRAAEFTATAIILGQGAVISLLTQDTALAIVSSAITAAGIIALYEFVLRRREVPIPNV